MIHFNRVTKVFKSDIFSPPFKALDNVEFSIPEGSMVGFLGANGAGKTTSLKIIMDFIRPSHGEVLFDPSLGSSRLEIFKKIGFLPERPYFYPNLTGEEFLFFMGSLSELTKKQCQHGINHWSSRFKIDHALKRELKTYSKGMLQRIGFMATILHRPKLVILDEPISGLDPIGRKELKDVIIEIHKEGTTVFFSTHIVPDVEEVCDRVIFLKSGKLVYDGEVSRLLNSEQHNYQFIFSTMRVEEVNSLKTPIMSSKNLPGGGVQLVVERENKDQLLDEALVNKFNIVKLESVKPSLEEIFYNQREQNGL